MTEIEYRWIAVRCCCQPTKVVGFLRVSDRQAAGPAIVVLTREPYTPYPRADGLPTVSVEAVQVPIREMGAMGSDGYSSEYAVYSDDHPIEFWRSVKGFVEAKCPA